MDDHALVRSAARGDERALEELIRRLAAHTYRFAIGMLGEGRDVDLALQEAFVRVARALARYDGGDDVEGWAFGLVRRVVADQVLWSGAAGTGPLAALPHDQREVLVMREVCGWNVARIAALLQASVDDVLGRLYSARAALHYSSMADARA